MQAPGQDLEGLYHAPGAPLLGALLRAEKGVWHRCTPRDPAVIPTRRRPLEAAVYTHSVALCRPRVLQAVTEPPHNGIKITVFI